MEWLFQLLLRKISLKYIIFRAFLVNQTRSVAQFGRALRSGRRGRRFKSCHFDYLAGAPKTLEIRFSVFFCVQKRDSEKPTYRHCSNTSTSAQYQHANRIYNFLYRKKIPGRETSLTSIISDFLHPGIPFLYFIVFVFSLFNTSPYILFRFTLLLQLLPQALPPAFPDTYQESVSGSCLLYRN